MSRSLVNAFPGLPPDADNGAWACILTSWTKEGLEDAVKKVNELNAKRWPDMAPIADGDGAFYRTLGEDGRGGREWFYIAVRMHAEDLVQNTMAVTTDRYGFQRWVWTED